MLAAIEICLSAIAIALAYTLPTFGAAVFKNIETGFGRLARRRRLSILSVGLAALAARLAVLPVLPVPVPAIHDEFSHLLIADTLAHGRVTNPAHPLWVHFETFHVNQKPTYASMYYPGQGFALAIGEVIFGHPFWGVWVSVGVMCAAICWALQGWMPASWALLGGLLAVMRLATFSYWGNTYYGGAVAAIGGALVLGAFPRIKRHLRIRDSLLMGLGLAILANTRPYESLFFCFPIGLALLAWLFGKSAHLKLFLVRLVLPLSLVLALTITAMGYYFWRVTGSPFRIPYQVNMAAYHLVYFPWQKLAPDAEYHHAVMREFYQGPPVAGQYRQARLHPLLWLLVKPLPHVIFFLGPALLMPIVVWLIVRPCGTLAKSLSRKTRFLLLLCGITMIGMVLPVYIPPAHYAAPMTAAIYALLLQAMRYLRQWRFSGQPSGLFLVRAVPVICLALLPVRAAASLLQIPVPVTVIHTWYSEDLHNLDRARVLDQLQRDPGQHLVVVRYSANHEVLAEWVYNQADIDNAKVVWARDMGAEKNEELLEYFRDRHAWLLEPDEKPLRLGAYECASSHCTKMVASGEGRRPKVAN